MARALHTAKLKDEKDAFFDALYEAIPAKEDLISGPLSGPARRLHAAALPAYIAKHYQPPGREFRSDYAEIAFSSLIESECAASLGLRNAAISSLRGCTEAAFKFLYYELHPVECALHLAGKYDLSGSEYREFAYSVPGIRELPFFERSKVERLWEGLCRYVHNDFRDVTVFTVVADLRSVLSAPEREFAATVELFRDVVKILLACLLAVEPRWLEQVEKVYYDAALEAFSVSERRAIRDHLRIA